MHILTRAVLPKGFKAFGLSAGLKKNGKEDLALFVSEVPATACCLTTVNTMAAAPVIVSREHCRKGNFLRAIIANSGGANAFTGAPGLRDARQMCRAAAKHLRVKESQVLVASTGIIGKRLDVSLVEKALPALVSKLSPKGIAQASRAIRTTDKFAKEATVKVMIGGVPVTVCGVAKGAGMISPKMATMFGFVFTDAAIEKGALRRALVQAVAASFNSITVDGCMSTNDIAAVFANGAAGNAVISGGARLKEFTAALSAVCLRLAKLMVQDGEGSTKVVTIRVTQARTAEEARTAALAIANSPLFKCAMFASSHNIRGRMVAAIGAAGIPVKEQALRIRYTDLRKRDVGITVALGRGTREAVIYSSDLSYEYVKVNAQYN